MTLLALGIGFGVRPAQAAMLDHAQVYRNALPLYRDPSQAPLQMTVGSVTAFGTGKLIRFSYAGDGGETVPALLFLPHGADKAHPVPCIVALHGLGGSKETMAGFALAAQGWGDATLAIDEYGQGERPRIQTPGGLLGIDTLAEGIRRTAIDVRRGLDLLDTRPEIDHAHIGLVGVSLGAIIGTVAAGVDPRIKAVVLVSGGGDWGLILKSLADENAHIAGQPLGRLRGSDWDAVCAQLAAEDPVTFAPHIAPRPILMEHGRKDWIIVPAAAQALYDAAAAPKDSHVHIDWFPNSGHVPAPELIYPKIQRFLARTLSGSATGTMAA